ncbi:MAG: DNA repair protein RecO [Lachnospiraceae bacterium]|nr:DNA repair protein RecO [Lachnospiraceae bacterium]
MKFSTDGLVIREQIIKEQDKLVTVLTRSNGIVRAFAHGAKSIKSSKSAATGLLTYSRFSFYSGRDRYIIDDAVAQEVFIALRKDVEKLALAQYFCELLINLAPEGESAEEYLRLTLNCLHFLCKGERDNDRLKSLFEFRILSMAGYMPNLICCDSCAVYEHDEMYFLPNMGVLVCGDCIGSYKERKICTGLGVTAAMRHCVYAEFQRLFAFSLSENSLPVLSQASEEYLINQLGKRLQTLDFYKQMRGVC